MRNKRLEPTGVHVGPVASVEKMGMGYDVAGSDCSRCATLSHGE